MVTKEKDTVRCLYEAPNVELLEIQEEEFILGYDDGSIKPGEEENWGEG